MFCIQLQPPPGCPHPCLVGNFTRGKPRIECVPVNVTHADICVMFSNPFMLLNTSTHKAHQQQWAPQGLLNEQGRLQVMATDLELAQL